MIIVTGAAGFIGSCLTAYLNEKGFNDLILVDDFTRPEKEDNYRGKNYLLKIDRDIFPEWFESSAAKVSFVFHLGARTDTTVQDESVFDRLNLNYSILVWKICSEANIPLVYASSAATYGDGKFGYCDDTETTMKIKPMNAYAVSKHSFDLWALKQENAPPRWYALKFFNVYGPNEYHKERMASVVLHAFDQIRKSNKVKLFHSHRNDYNDGEQLRDFIYVKDVLKVCMHFYSNKPISGIYNVGTGEASTFIRLVDPIFKELKIPSRIEFFPIPEDIRDTYQYFTEATTEKLRKSGFKDLFTSVEEGVSEYVKTYLKEHKYY